MLNRTLSVVALASMLLAAALPASAQTDQARVIGVVIDGSGGALPGVTVTIGGANTRQVAVITDATGRYLTPWLPPGLYTIRFELSGFETRSVPNLRLDAGQTVVLDQQLPLASLSETVQVTAPAPDPPPPPAPPPPPRPKAVPVDKDILASVCGPRQSAGFSRAIGRVVSAYNSDRHLLGPGDQVRLDAGEKQGVAKGQNLVVRRRFKSGEDYAWAAKPESGEQASALVQVLESHDDSSMAIVVYACSEIVAGDTVEPYVPQPAFFAVTAGTPRYDEPAKIIIGEHGRRVGAVGQMMVIDRGIMQGVQRGQRLTIFRRQGTKPAANLPIGDGVVIAIRADSATFLIERATDAATVGDMVALHR